MSAEHVGYGRVTNPIDLIERLSAAHDWSCDRTNDDELTLAECARQTVIAHNDPSHVRDRVLRLFDQHHIPANILVSLPSLEGIKRAVAMQMGVALLPRRCAESEIVRGELIALAMPEVRLLQSVSGAYDLIAVGVVPSVDGMDLLTDRIGAIDGVGRTTSSIVLSTKFER